MYHKYEILAEVHHEVPWSPMRYPVKNSMVPRVSMHLRIQDDTPRLTLLVRRRLEENYQEKCRHRLGVR